MEDDNEQEEQGEIGQLIKLLEDSERRYDHVNESLEGTMVRNRQLSISLNKEKDDRMRMILALNMAREKADEHWISLNNNLEKVSQLENEIEQLTQEKQELLSLLESERERNALLQNDVEVLHATEPSSLKPGTSGEDVVDLMPEDETYKENFLQNIIVLLKQRLDAKENECNELEDKLAVVHEELANQREQLLRASSEFEKQLSKVNEDLAKERHLNSILSEESDQRVSELQTTIQEKDELNTELQDIRDLETERRVSVEEQCRFFRTKLKQTEKRLSVYWQSLKEQQSAACQVNESELAPLGEGWPVSSENEKVYEIFTKWWNDSDAEKNRVGNSKRYAVNIVKLIQNGFKSLGGNLTVLKQKVQ